MAANNLSIIEKDEHFSEFCKIPMNVLARYGTEFPFDLYLKLSSNKIVKVNNRDESTNELFNKYKERGVEHIFIKHECFQKFIKEYNEKLKFNLFAKLNEKEKVLTLDEAFHFVKNSFNSLSFNENAIELASNISKNSIKLMSTQKNIFKFYLSYKENCNKEFLKGLMTSYATNIMIGTFIWQSQSIKEKAALGCLLKDILLVPEDFEAIRKCNGNWLDLPPNLKNHGANICQTIKQNNKEWLATETQTIIEQHHEVPDGSGFPYGFDHNRITLLSALHIISQHFIEAMANYDFDPKMKSKILANIKQKFNIGHYKTAYATLLSVMGIILEE